LASKKVSPKGPASGMRMLNFYINRGGTGLTEERQAELEKAKGLLSERIAEEKGKAKSAPKKHTRTAATTSKKKTAAKTRASKTTGRKSVKTARSHKS
jgi:topoisomerase IA-like protein